MEVENQACVQLTQHRGLARKLVSFTAKIILWGVVGLIVFLIFSPAYCDYTVRAKVSEMIGLMSSARTTIYENIVEKKMSALPPSEIESISEVFRCSPCTITDFSVYPDGKMSLASTELGVYVSYIPSIEYDANKKPIHMTWECSGHPYKHMPSSCRSDAGYSSKEKICVSCHEEGVKPNTTIFLNLVDQGKN